MSKHRKHKRDYERYEEQPGFNQGNGNFNNLAGILGNIDINQITSLLNATGILGNNLNGFLGEEKVSNEGGSKDSLLNNIDITQLISQANELNSMINNSNEIIDEEQIEVQSSNRSKNGKERRNSSNNINNYSIPTGALNGDPITTLLNAIKPLVAQDKASILEKIMELYIQGKL